MLHVPVIHQCRLVLVSMSETSRKKFSKRLPLPRRPISKPSFEPLERRIPPHPRWQRPTMKFVATKTADQLDLQALHRVRERLVSQRTGIINQIRAFLLERGIAVRQGQRFLRAELPRILASPPDVLSPRMVRAIEDLAGDFRRLDERIEGLSNEIEAVARQDAGGARLMSIPGIGPIISSAMVAAIGTRDSFKKGRDFAAWLGLVPRQISTGDRTILGKISRRGNRYLRVLFVQAAWVRVECSCSWSSLRGEQASSRVIVASRRVAYPPRSARG